MAIWYEGNLNKSENRHEENGAVYYVRGVRESEGRRYERYAVATHFIERGEDFVEVMRRYVSPLYQEGDVVTLSEKVVSMCQNNTVEMKDVKVGFWAKFLSRFATHNQNGIAMDEPYKLQLAIDMKGLPLILWACFRTLIGKFTGHRGVFYEIVGQDVAASTGFTATPPSRPTTPSPSSIRRIPDGVCRQVKEALGISCMVVDANDIDVEILGKSPDLRTSPLPSWPTSSGTTPPARMTS